MSGSVFRDSRWVLQLYPEAGEAGGCLQSSRQSGSGGHSSPERVEAEAGRRAKGRIRRYCAANRLNRLGTLTYAGAGCHDPVGVRQNVGRFFKSLREELGGEPFPYLWVPEVHPGGHGLHAHFAVGRYIKRSLIEESWRHGFVHIKLLGDLPVVRAPWRRPGWPAATSASTRRRRSERGAFPVCTDTRLLGMNGGVSLGAPDGGESARVEAVEASPAGADDDVVEDGGDDRVLPGKRE